MEEPKNALEPSQSTPDPNSENLRTLYIQLCASYHAVDDFRAKLLGLLPLGSALAILGLLNAESKGHVTPYLLEIGLFGIFVTLGLLLYELKGIQKCTGFIYYGHLLEKTLLNNLKSPHSGQFMGLSLPERGWWFATEPVASAFIYATVMAAWVYVASIQNLGTNEKPNYTGNMLLTVLSGIVAFMGVVLFWRFWAKPKTPVNMSKLESDSKA